MEPFLKQRLKGINLLLSDIFDTEVRISFLLEELGFSEQQAVSIRGFYLEQTIDSIENCIKSYLLVKDRGERSFNILVQRYGLNGNSQLTLNDISHLHNISRERVRQLLQKTLRTLKSVEAKNHILSSIRNFVSSILNHVPIVIPSEVEVKNYTKVPSKPQETTGNSYTFDQIRKKYPKAYERWTPQDDEDLRINLLDGDSIEMLSKHFMRNFGAIRSRIKKLGLSKK